jgi:predicted  nucleic acid-binding Zn-ribbon protein
MTRNGRSRQRSWIVCCLTLSFFLSPTLPQINSFQLHYFTKIGTRRELEDTRQRYEVAEKQCTRASFAIAELASLACRVKSSVEEEEIHDDFELNIRRTRHTLEMCAVMQSKLKQLKSNMKKSQNQNKLSTATETSLRKQLNDAIRKFETLKEDRNKRKSDSNRRVRELKMSLSRKSKLLDASKTRVEELEAELLSLRTKHKSLRSRVERSENSMSRRENLAKDTQKRFTEIGKDLKSHKEELAACKSRLKAEISALKSCRSRNESLREEIARLREKKVSEKKKTSSSPKKNNTLKRLRDEMYRVQASERAARSQVKTLSSELKKQKLRVSELVSDATARAKRFDEDLKRTIDAEKQKLQELRTATESISEAVVAMFAALLARNARLHKGLSRHRKDMEETEEDKREDEDVWTLRERHQEILKAVQNAVDRRPPDELTLQVLLAETVQERVRVQSARDVLLRDSSSSLNGDDDVGSVIRRYEELVEELRGRLSVERVSSRLAIEKYEAQLSALKLRQSSSSVMS